MSAAMRGNRDLSAPTRSPRVSAVIERLKKFIASDNIADMLSTEKLADIGGRVCREYEIDERSNTDWRETANKALDIALQVAKPKNYPFPGASNIKYPLITVAALQFNARAYPAIVDGNNIVKANVVGSDKGVPKTDEAGNPLPVMDPQTGQPMPGPDGQPQIQWEIQPGAKRERADRISRHMSYQLSEEMEEWEEDTDTLLMQLPIVGTAFRKVYYDPSLGRNKSEMISGVDVVVHRKTRALETAPRITHILPLYPGEIQERQRAGLWVKDFEPGEAVGDMDGDEDAPHTFLEQHRLYDLDEDGYREPYIVTVHKETEQVVRIVANYGVDDIKVGPREIERVERRDYFVKYGFIPDPKGGFYDIGFGRLLESLNASIDSAINMMLDAGHLQNAGGGFIGSGVRLKKNELRMEPGVYRTVDASGSKLREAIVNIEHPGPSAVLFNMLGLLIEAAKDITAVQNVMTGNGKDANQTATTTLALIEQGMKVFTAIYKRIYRSLKREFKLLYRLNAENLDDEAYFTVLDEQEAVAKADYAEGDYDVCPQADPRLVTDMQRMARAQLLMQTMDINPEARLPILRRYYTAIGVEDIDELLQQPAPNPLQEADAQATVEGKQAKAARDKAAAAKDLASIDGGAESRAIDRAKVEQAGAMFAVDKLTGQPQQTEPA